MKIEVRNVKPEELDEVVRVEEEAWPPELRAPREKFESRMGVHLDGFYEVYVDERLVGTSTSICVNYKPGDIFDWGEITDNGYGRNHSVNGNALYVVSVGTSQAEYMRPIREQLRMNGGKSLGTLLVEKQQELAKRLGKEYLVLTARIPGYRKYFEQNQSATVEEYLKLTIQKDGRSEPYDPETRFYTRCGLQVASIIPNAEEDVDSMNYGIIMYWRVR